MYGDAAIAAMSIVNRFVMFINSSMIGFGQGFQPVCGFCFGAGKYSRVRQAYTYCIKVGTVVLLGLGVVSFIFAQQIVTLFRRDDLQVIEIGTMGAALAAVHPAPVGVHHHEQHVHPVHRLRPGRPR